ncbi:MAG: 4Fe-4S dicluster domain-containing protein [Bacteriovoracaceae bacterium]|nr:4Fe-4S dicluster domain-containing protein [Bacteriovoracaceae bacterium]
MNKYFIKAQDFETFVTKLVEAKQVIGPVAKKSRFVFEKLKNSKELRLDYDVTVLPPKKEFFPTCQPIVKFEGDKFEGCVNVEEKILFGVHFYDIKALDMTDLLYNENHRDINYMAHREAATIVGSNVQNIAERAFFGTVGVHVKPKGHDAFLTKIDDGYLFETYTDKGEALVSFGTFTKAKKEHESNALDVNNRVMGKCPEVLDYVGYESVANKVRKAFNNTAFWEDCAKDCFSCGSCNIVCPTCYCFDVQDNWNVDQVSGTRTRKWDGCLTEDFAKISLGFGAQENFREKRGDRFRHRIMRKTTYLNAKLGGPACVGCGRCSMSCTSDIADPVNVINKIMEV